jgi:hypothetical protein
MLPPTREAAAGPGSGVAGTYPKPTIRITRPPSTPGFAVYALSRGKGVPEKARGVLEQVRKLAEADQREGLEVTIQASRIGLEGETRLCVQYGDPEAASRALERVKVLAHGVDLVNVVVEPCGDREPDRKSKRQEGKS